MVRTRLTLISFALGIAAVAVPQRPVLQATLELPKTLVVGKPVTAALRVVIPAGWHAYANPPSQDFQIPISVKSGSTNLRVRNVKYPSGELKSAGGSESSVYQGTIRIPFEMVLAGRTGKAKIAIKVGYQLCDDTSCLPPAELIVSREVTVGRP